MVCYGVIVCENYYKTLTFHLRQKIKVKLSSVFSIACFTATLYK